MANLVGKTIGKYNIIEFLGKGGMAEVYKAYHPKLERYVAIKILHGFLGEGEDFRGRFDREAKAIASLRHANIVQIYDFDIEEDHYYMVMEFIGGGTLQSRMWELSKSGRYMPVGQVSSIITQIAEALDYAHSKGIIHRDIKPSNILMDSNGDAYIADFGISRMMSGTQLTATGTLIGTPTYMSPEQGMGANLTAVSDIYSLGVILFELLTGKAPFTSETTPLAIIHKHIYEPPPNPRILRPDLTEEVEQVILKALAKDPKDRYQSGRELVRALGNALPHEMVEKLDSTDEQADVTIMAMPTVPFESAGTVSDLSNPPITAIEEAARTEIQPPPPIQAKSPEPMTQLVGEQPRPEIAPLKPRSIFVQVREGWDRLTQAVSKLKIPALRIQPPADSQQKRLPKIKVTVWWIVGIVLVGILVVVGVLLKPATPPSTIVGPPGIVANGYVYFTSDVNGKAEVWMLDPKGLLFQVTHTPDPYESWSPAPAANGYVYFTSNASGKTEVWMIDPNGQLFQVTHTPGSNISWSPAPAVNGYVYFTSDATGKAEIWMIDPKGVLFQVTHTPNTYESWSPAPAANDYVYFTSNTTSKVEVWMIDPKGALFQVTHTADPYESWTPAPAPNGYVYFTSNASSKAEVWMIDPNGQLFQVTHEPDPYISWSPAPAPKGYMYFTSNASGKAEVWMIDPKGALYQVIHTPDPFESWVLYFHKPLPYLKR